MGRARIIFKNSSVLAVSMVMGKLFCFLLFVAIARQLGPDDLGKYAFAISFTSIFLVISELGLNTLAVRDVSADKSLGLSYISNLALLRVVLSGVAFVVVFFLVWVLGYPPETIRIVVVMGLAIFLASIANGMRWYFQAQQRLEYESLLIVLQNLLFLLLGIFALMLKTGILGVVFFQAVVGAITLFLTWVIIQKKFIKFKFELNFSLWKTLLKKTIPFALMLIFVTLYLYADTVLLSFFKGDTTVGWYNAGNRLIGAGKMMPMVIIPAMFPAMAECFKSSREEFNNLIEKALVFMFFVALPLSLSVTLLADKIILFLYGKEFLPAILALRILAWAMFGVFFSAVLGCALISANHQNTNTTIVGIGLGTSLILNLSLIPSLGHIGTSLAIAVTEWVVFLLGGYYVRKYLDFDFGRIIKPFGKVIFATAITALCIWWVKQFSFVLALISGASVYAGCILFLKGFYGYDYQRIKGIILSRFQPKIATGR